jgi:hypothetical protein
MIRKTSLMIYILVLISCFLFSVVNAEEEGMKSVGKARLYSSIIGGPGQFYIGNFWKGMMDLTIQGALATGTIILIDKAGDAPTNEELEAISDTTRTSKEEYIGLAVFTGISYLVYHGFQLWRLNDDVVAHNYKKRFIEPYSFRFDVKKNGVIIGATMTF